jgi:RNA polymerase sigma-70 factor (ECF subfamily)
MIIHGGFGVSGILLLGQNLQSNFHLLTNETRSRTFLEVRSLALAEHDRRPISSDATKGDTSFAQIVCAHWNSVYRLLSAMTRNVHDTEELTQETFLRALRQFMSLNPQSNIRAWLLRIATNAWSDVRRKRRRVGFESLEREPQERAAPAETAVELAEQSRLARSAMNDLSETSRAVFHLRVVEELSYRDIAEMLETTEEAARWQMHDARRRLLRHMTK